MMGTDQLRGVLEGAGLRVSKCEVAIHGPDGSQMLYVEGARPDGSTFARSSRPFTGDPVEIARLMALTILAPKIDAAPADSGTLAAAINRGADKIASAVPIAAAIVDGNLSKATELAGRARKFHADLGSDIDKTMARYDALDKRKGLALAKHGSYQDRVASDLTAAEAAVDQLSNVPL